MNRPQLLNRLAGISLMLLILHGLAWELWLAPLRPGGSFLALKALPLLLPLAGILRGRRYTHQWASMLILAYFTEGVVRATSDPGAATRAMATVEVALTLVFFFSAIFYARFGSEVKRPPGD